VGKIRHFLQNGMDLRHHVLAVDDHRRHDRRAQGGVEDGALLGDVDLRPPPPSELDVRISRIRLSVFRPESVCRERTRTSLNECARGRTERRLPAGRVDAVDLAARMAALPADAKAASELMRGYP